MTPMTQPQRAQPIQGVLPAEARAHLVAASKVKGDHAKRVAVDAAIDYVKLRFPQYFHPTPNL